jgi:hypothetical protein
MIRSISFSIPIKTISEANCSEHWTAKSKRHRQQALFTRLAFKKHVSEAIPIPCTITLTRVASKSLDSDNLQMAFKWIRDEVADIVFPEYVAETFISKTGKFISLKGRNDDRPGLTWKYDQKKGKGYSIIISIDF